VTLYTGDVRDKATYTVGCTVENSTSIAHSPGFTIEIDADFQNTSNYKSDQMNLRVFQYLGNSSFNGVRTKNVYYKELKLDSGFLYKPSKCELG